MQTLTKFIKESLEGKLPDQIRASLEVEDDEINEGLLKYIDKNAYSIQPYDISKSSKLIQYLVKEYLYPYKKLLAVHVPDEKQFVLRFKFMGGTATPSGKSPIFRANNDVCVYSHVGEANFIQIHDKKGYTYIFGE